MEDVGQGLRMWGGGVPTILSLQLGPLGAGVIQDPLCLLQLGPVFSCLVLHGAGDLLHAHLGGGKYGG